ncbi:tumor necrosis factor ligand superfamily member 18 [Trichechus inunguis]
MSSSHVENMPLNHSSPQGTQRSSGKLWLLCSTIIFLLLCLFITLIFIFLLLKTVNEPCVAKFGPLPSGWQITSSEPLCVAVDRDEKSDWKLKILRSGLYVIYGQVAPNTTYKEPAPFAVQLRKNNAIIQTLTDNSKTHNIGGTYEFHAGDTIALRFNYKYQVLKNDTYWGILLVANPQFVS